MLDLVRGNPTRLVALLAATAAAYLCMALEAWVILRAAGAVDYADRRARGRDVLARRELRAPRSSRRTSARSKHRVLPRSTAVGAARRRRRARPRPAAPRPVLGRSRAGDLPARARDGVGSRNRAARTRQRPSRPTTLLYLPHDAAVTRSARPRGLPGCRWQNACSAPPGAPATTASSSGSRSTRMATSASGLRRLMRNIGGEIVIATNRGRSGAQRSRRSPPDGRRDGDRRRDRSCRPRSCSDAREIPVAGHAVADVPAGAEWRVSGVAAAHGRAPQPIHGRCSGRSPTAGTRGAAALGQGRVATARRGWRFASPTRPISPRRSRRSGARATRTPTPKSRASTAACRCRSASRCIRDAAHRQPAVGDARRSRVLFGVAVQHRPLPGRRARRVPVARRQRARRLRRRNRAAEVPGVRARMLD